MLQADSFARTLIDPECSLQCSQNPTTGPYPEPDETCPIPSYSFSSLLCCVCFDLPSGFRQKFLSIFVGPNAVPVNHVTRTSFLRVSRELAVIFWSIFIQSRGVAGGRAGGGGEWCGRPGTPNLTVGKIGRKINIF